MATRIFGKICKCEACNWIGPYNEVKSMAGYEFCPSCSYRYVGFMPDFSGGQNMKNNELWEALCKEAGFDDPFDVEMDKQDADLLSQSVDGDIWALAKLRLSFGLSLFM